MTTVHHLNCGTMCPLCDRLMNDQQGSWTQPGHLVCHCLLVETNHGLVLVDTGMGLEDIANPTRRFGRAQPAIFRPTFSVDEAAITQVRGLGFDPRDVQHIITTHLDPDHAGGLSDFPWAKVHVMQSELDQVIKPTLTDRMRFSAAQFEHRPDWATHAEDGEDWFGFQRIRPVPGIDVDILMIPLIGHTRGHVGVAVQQGGRWLLHCGDAYYHASQVTETPQMPAGLRMFERTIAANPKARARNLERLRQLALSQPDTVDLFCAHDPTELARYDTVAPSTR